MYGGIKPLQTVHQPAGLLRPVHDVAQHHEQLFEHIARPSAQLGPAPARIVEITDHRLIEQPLLVAEEFVQRTFRNTQLLRNVVHAHRPDTMRDEHAHGPFHDAIFGSHDR